MAESRPVAILHCLAVHVFRCYLRNPFVESFRPSRLQDGTATKLRRGFGVLRIPQRRRTDRASGVGCESLDQPHVAVEQDLGRLLRVEVLLQAEGHADIVAVDLVDIERQVVAILADSS